MLIIGTGGLGKEILGILIEDNYPNEIIFFDEDKNAPCMLYDKFQVIKSEKKLKALLKKNAEFITGVGHPRMREKVTLRLEKMGGILTPIISKRTSIFPFNEKYEGIIIQPGVGISHNAKFGKCCAVHINSTIGHSCEIGNFVNIGPNVSIIGPVCIGDYSYISAQATILPHLTLGKNVVVTAGKVVNRNLNDFETF